MLLSRLVIKTRHFEGVKQYPITVLGLLHVNKETGKAISLVNSVHIV